MAAWTIFTSPSFFLHSHIGTPDFAENFSLRVGGLLYGGRLLEGYSPGWSFWCEDTPASNRTVAGTPQARTEVRAIRHLRGIDPLRWRCCQGGCLRFSVRAYSFRAATSVVRISAVRNTAAPTEDRVSTPSDEDHRISGYASGGRA